MGWTLTQTMTEDQFYNGETDTTADEAQHEAVSPTSSTSSPQAPYIIHPLSKDRVEQLNAAHAGHRDDLALLHRLHPLLTDEQRPRSLAVPWMTTSTSLQQQPPSPVMTMSPQAAYMSKIIPNAVLPPSIDVVEISRGRSRSSVRTVSKSSLLLSSPAPSRASSRASSSRTASSKFTSASRYNGPSRSDTSCWANSDSDTLVSDSSTISSGTTPRQSSQNTTSTKENVGNLNFSDGKVVMKEDQIRKDGQFSRSLSVTKSKRPPPPPNRSYSLHSKMKRRSRELLEVRVIPGEESAPEKNKSSPHRNMDSPDYHADTSSLDESTGSAAFAVMKSELQQPKIEHSKKVTEIGYNEVSYKKQAHLEESKPIKVVSPSSGYSSQDGTSPQFTNPPHLSSPKQKNNNFLTNLTRLIRGPSKVAKTAKPTGEPKSDTVSVSPSVQTLRELFNIPPPPKIHAPPPPPPEVWAHSKRSFELLLGPPAPDNVYAIIKKNPKDRRQQRQSPSASTQSSVKSLVLERKLKNPPAESTNGLQGSVLSYAEVRKEHNERLAQNGDLKEVYKDEKGRMCDMLNGILVKAVEKQEIKEGCQVKTITDILPTISSPHISPSPQLDQRTTTEITDGSKVQVMSPESPWPLPPPPMNITRPEATDFPLPPPPLFGEAGLVLPKQSGPGEVSSSTSASVKPKVKVEQVVVLADDEVQQLSSSMSVPPPPPYSAPPPPTAAAQKVLLPPPPVGSTTYVLQEVIQRGSSPAKEPSPPVNVEVLASPPKTVKTLLGEASRSAGEAAPESKLAPPQSIPPPPPLPSHLQLSKQHVDPPHENIPPEPKAADQSNSISTIPQSIPPPLELLKHSVMHQTADDPAADEAPPSPPFEFKNPPSLKEAEAPPVSIPVPPPLPVQVTVSSNHHSSLLNAENQSQEKNPAPDGHKEPTSVITPSLLQQVKLRSVSSSPEPREGQEQASVTAAHKKPTATITHSLLHMIKLRSVNSSPEPPEAAKEETTSAGAPSLSQKDQLQSAAKSPEAPEQPEPEATVTQQPPSTQTPASSSSETPQKPIRKSLILLNPDPPQSVVVPPASPAPVAPSAKKSPTAMTSSMNLQEAIRLRTAARAKESPASRLSLHSPVSPPSTSPSFVFSKSNKMVGVVTKPKQENKEAAPKNSEDSPGTKVTSPAESKAGLKLPPPVAKKPKNKSKEVEADEAVEQTAGQEAQDDGINGEMKKK